MRQIWDGVKAAWRFGEWICGWMLVLAYGWFAAVYIIGSLHAGRFLNENELIWLAFRVRVR